MKIRFLTKLHALYVTRGPWTATLALIKSRLNKTKKLYVNNIQNWSNSLRKGTVHLYSCKKQLQKRPFSLATLQLDVAMDQSERVKIDAQTLLYLPRYHLSGLIQPIGSYLATAKMCRTWYFLFAPIY